MTDTTPVYLAGNVFVAEINGVRGVVNWDGNKSLTTKGNHMTTNEKYEQQLQEWLKLVLAGETVEIGIFQVYEDYVYKREKDIYGNPLFNRVLSLVYYDEGENDNPSREEFDGTLQSFRETLEKYYISSEYDED